MGCHLTGLGTRLVNTVPVDEPCWNHSAAVNVYPTLVQNTNGRTSYFPLMKRFVHTSNRPDAGTWFLWIWRCIDLWCFVFCWGFKRVGSPVGSDWQNWGFTFFLKAGHDFLMSFLELFNCILDPEPFLFGLFLGDESPHKMPEGEHSTQNVILAGRWN